MREVGPLERFRPRVAIRSCGMLQCRIHIADIHCRKRRTILACAGVLQRQVTLNPLVDEHVGSHRSIQPSRDFNSVERGTRLPA